MDHTFFSLVKGEKQRTIAPVVPADIESSRLIQKQLQYNPIADVAR